MTRPLIYIAGPYRGATPYDVEQNVRRAEMFGLFTAYAGGIPLIPHSMFRFFDKQLDDAFWIEGTLALLRRCDAIIAIPGWKRSVGARGEVDVAKAAGMPGIFHEAPRVAFPQQIDRTRIHDFIVRTFGPQAGASPTSAKLTSDAP